MDDEPDVASIAACYAEARQDLRFLLELRFRHFTSYLAIVTILGAGVFVADPPRETQLAFLTLALILTVLFWRLDRATHGHIRAAKKWAQQLERRLPFGDHPTSDRRYGASAVTNTIYFVATASWAIVLVQMAIFD